MQKVEEIMRAEEAARHAVAEAREQAAALVREAERTAAQAVATEREQTARAAAELLEQHLADAHARAGADKLRADEATKAVIADAQSRMNEAVEVALERLQD